MYEPMWPFLLTYGSHDMRLTGFCRLTVANGTPGKWGVTRSVQLCVVSWNSKKLDCARGI